MKDHHRVIEALRANGYAVRVTHHRANEAEIEASMAEIEGRRVRHLSPEVALRTSPRGGYTKVEIARNIARKDAEPILRTEAVGFAYCEPRDNYDRTLGLRIALGRALLTAAPYLRQTIGLPDNTERLVEKGKRLIATGTAIRR